MLPNQPSNQQSNEATERPTNDSTHQPVSQLISYLLFLADNALIIGHRNSQWCGHGPVLEQDIALTNIALDQIGQARYFYQYAAELTNQLTHQPIIQSTSQPTNPSTEDTLAYLRDTRSFKNCLLVEQRNGDWGKTIVRQFLFSAYQSFLYRQLQNSKDERIAAISARSLKETTYHLRWSSEWVIRLGDGTNESHSRMTTALDELWPYTTELFTPVDYEKQMWEEGIGANCANLHDEWQQKVQEVFAEAGLSLHNGDSEPGGLSGKEGIHTEHLGYLLAEMQFLQRAYPNCNW
jgi:ring-1,2-phenylacetyl-CoA epoxidase subunit PaaC